MGQGYHNAVSVVVVIIDLHRTASVAGSLDVAGAVGAAGCEGAGACWFAGWGRADGGALLPHVSTMYVQIVVDKKVGEGRTRDTTRSPWVCSSSGTLGGRSGTSGPSSLTLGGRGGPVCRELVSE